MNFEIEVGADVEDIGDIQAFQDSADQYRPRSSSMPKQVRIRPGGSAPSAMLTMAEDMSPLSPTRARRLSEGSSLSEQQKPESELMALCDGRGDGRLATYLANKKEQFGSSGSFGSLEDVGSISRKAHVRAVVQQVTSAQLQVAPTSEGKPPELVQIHKGIIIYICFLKGAKKADADEMSKVLLSAKMCENEDGKAKSILDLPGDLLILPQPTLVGKVKGKLMQYHRSVSKDDGRQLYEEFVSVCRRAYEKHAKCVAARRVVRHGVYGMRQPLTCQSNGPDTHLIEI